MSMRKSDQQGLSTAGSIGIVLGLIIIGVVGWLLFAPSDEPEPVVNQPDTSQPESNEPEEQTENDPTNTEAETVTVTYTNSGYSPSSVTIKQGDTVRFVNNSSRDFHPASNDHPTHTIYPEFDAGEEIGPGGSYSFTFNRVGTWGYHNHELEGHTGTIVVTQ